MEFTHTDEVLVGGCRAEVCLFCDRHVPAQWSLSPSSREMWKAAASVANYLEIRMGPDNSPVND